MKKILNLDKLKKILSSLGIISLSYGSTFAVKVAENSQKQDGGGSSSLPQVIGMALASGVFIATVLVVVLWAGWKFISKINETKRRYDDILYNKYVIETKHCKKNSDRRLKRKAKRFLWMMNKKAPVLVNSDTGLRKIGTYEGEMDKKEGFYLIYIKTPLSLFKREDFILIFPYDVKHLIRKNQHGKDWELVLDVQGVDEVGNADYYLMPVIKDVEQHNRAFLDFSDYIQKNYFDKYIFREVIKNQSIDYAENVKKATDMNSNLQTYRKVK